MALLARSSNGADDGSQRLHHWLPLLSVVVAASIWYLITGSESQINPLFLPSPASVLQAFFNLAATGLIIDVLATVTRVMIAFAVSAALALPVAFLLFESRLIRTVLLPYLDFIRYIPVPVLIPLTILFFGIGETTKIALLFIGTFFQVVLLFMSDLGRVPSEYFELAYSLKFSTWKRLVMQFRAAAPPMYDNLRISLGLAWSYVIIVELVAAESGLGHLIKEAQRFSHTADIYVGILLMGLIGFASDYLFRHGARSLFPYRHTS